METFSKRATYGWDGVQLLLAILLWNVASNSRRQLTAAVYTPDCDINWKHELFIVYTFKLKFVIMIFLYSFWMLYLSHWKWFPSSIGVESKSHLESTSLLKWSWSQQVNEEQAKKASKKRGKSPRYHHFDFTATACFAWLSVYTPKQIKIHKLNAVTRSRDWNIQPTL